MRKLAEITGVSHGAPYRHFKNKTVLLEAIAARGYNTISSICEDARNRYTNDCLLALEEAGIGYLLFVAQNQEVANLMFNGVLPPSDWGEELQNASNQAIKSLRDIIELGKLQGIYAEFDITDITMTSLATIHGLSMFMSGGLLKEKFTDEESLRALGKRTANILFSGLLRR